MKPKVSSSKKWEILSEFRVQNSEFKIYSLIKVLLANRGIKTKKESEEFVDPKLENVTVGSVGINKKQLQKAVARIKKAISNKEKIVVFGDYDVDGICGTAILWETLYSLGAKAMPYIPHRMEEGYGLSSKGISNIQFQMSNIKLIITVDNGIVANEAVEFANKQGIDVIITDHHVPSKKLPMAYAIVHTTKLCGAGVAYLLSQNIKYGEREDNHLELVALATIADLVPLLGANRTLTYYGLQKLKNSKRPGLLALFEEAEINTKEIGVWEVGHVIAPRLNAMGRIEYAMDSLRLLCTKDKTRAKKLADLLGKTNRERQLLTLETTQHAASAVRSQRSEVSGQKSDARKLLFIAHESYQQGVIGLVAGKMVEEFYRPAIVVSKGKKYSKASARSVHGFNIIEFIRSASEFLVDAGGHPMAAGFTVETEKLPLLEKALHDLAHKSIDADKLVRLLRIDCELPLPLVDSSLYDKLQKLAPFGMGNPEPSFVSKNVVIEDMRVVGQDGKHVKLRLQQLTINPSASLRAGNQQSTILDGIAFGMGERAHEFHVGDKVDIVYTVDEDIWNGNKKLQLKIRDARLNK